MKKVSIVFITFLLIINILSMFVYATAPAEQPAVQQAEGQTPSGGEVVPNEWKDY